MNEDDRQIIEDNYKTEGMMDCNTQRILVTYDGGGLRKCEAINAMNPLPALEALLFAHNWAKDHSFKVIKVAIVNADISTVSYNAK